MSLRTIYFKTEMFSASRGGTANANVTIILTDSDHAGAEDVAAAVAKASRWTEIFVLGFGSDVSPAHLQLLSSGRQQF